MKFYETRGEQVPQTLGALSPWSVCTELTSVVRRSGQCYL